MTDDIEPDLIDALHEDVETAEQTAQAELVGQISERLGIDPGNTADLIKAVGKLYIDRMEKRFTDLKLRERLKRTNPFLLQVRGVRTVREWAENQVGSALFASEEEAIGHVLEMIAKTCHPSAQPPTLPDDFDFQVTSPEKVRAFQIKMSWDCMPMSSRKNLSNTIVRCRAHYEAQGIEFEGIFAPCYGKAQTTSPPGQAYISMRSRDFWQEVGNGDPDYDARVGDVCRMLCSEFRAQLYSDTIPLLIDALTKEGIKVFGNANGEIDYTRLFREINR